MNDVLATYADPCVSSRKSSIESAWLYPSDFGECYPPASDLQLYPRITPVYNGEVLDVEADLVHASLSGISIKHYYGKCYREEENEEKTGDEDISALHDSDQGEDRDFGFDSDIHQSFLKSKSEKYLSASISSSTGDFEYRDSILLEGQPLCTLPRINYRNSFWNVHRPELCKLTWGQKYVGASTVIDHLHDHLVHHGVLCEKFHSEEARTFLLNRELDEYVRLKVLACPRELPPDEPLFYFEDRSRVPKIPRNPRCKALGTSEGKASHPKERFLQLSDDEDEIKDKSIRRSKEEFCLTIGKHIRKPPILSAETTLSEEYGSFELPSGGEEEDNELFYYNWLLYCGEKSFGQSERKDDSITASIPDSAIDDEPCPPLMMDEFCKAAGKVDFSDVRCDPDF